MKYIFCILVGVCLVKCDPVAQRNEVIIDTLVEEADLLKVLSENNSLVNFTEICNSTENSGNDGFLAAFSKYPRRRVNIQITMHENLFIFSIYVIPMQKVSLYFT